jgi:phosphoadenosine phosphosulfate reductase
MASPDNFSHPAPAAAPGAELAARWQEALAGWPAAEVLKLLTGYFPGGVCFSTSFSFEDQVITDIICRAQAAVSFFTLDTGRLFPETYGAWSRTLARYAVSIQAYYPDERKLADYVTTHGPDAFYQSVELRKACCHIRKVLPLKKALQGKSVWITGLRAEHSPTRKNMAAFEWDDAHQVIKYHPLLYWTTQQVREHIRVYDVPYNPLHDTGFVSIGCAPCTRAIRPGEDFRAGRWWWEEDKKKECGLHTHNPKPISKP